MTAKLIKNGNAYSLKINGEYVAFVNEDFIGYATQKFRDNLLGKLSLKNCQAIENGYDLDELFDEVFEKRPKEAQFVDGYDFKQGVMAGFQKALEILGDKKFSEDDVRRAFSAGLSIGYGRQFEIENKQIEIDNYIQSLQQTEWEVDICVWRANDQDLKEHLDISQPKLDADGNLILKRK